MSDDQIEALKEAARALQTMRSSLSSEYEHGRMIWWTANDKSVNGMVACLGKLRDLEVEL